HSHSFLISAMGAALNRFWKKDEGDHILMVGLDGAGSTTILFQFKYGKCVETLNAYGLNVEQISHNNIAYTILDVGRPFTNRALWHYYYTEMKGVIFVIDSSDVNRIEEAKTALESIIDHPEMANTKLLVFANKKDLPNALSADELTDRLQLKSRTQNDHFKWHVQTSNANTAEGIYEGLAWMGENLRE
ncbi:hypothetical protein PFISCL1PPCAC_9279, partial [Pristionchus fissidentatus]